MRRTKIIATIGPASNNPDTIRAMLNAGMDIARLNFSHGTHEEHAHLIQLLRRVARELSHPLAILQDLQGPKIRTGTLINGEPVELVVGASFTITTHDMIGNASIVSTTYKHLPHDVQPGDRILVSDGVIELHVIRTDEHTVYTQVVYGGMLREKQGMNLPGVTISEPSLTEKDIADLAFGIAQGVDYVALSFVRSASDITHIKQHIAAAGSDIPVIAKIEKPEALNDLPGILTLSDGIMIARGDLGVEIPNEQVPPMQKMMIDMANDMGVPVITATQMLESMTHSPRPTRAEASDVANAIYDGSDAVMLSGETANGHYPVEAVTMMARIAVAAEASKWYHEPATDLNITPQHDIPLALSEAARAMVEALPVQAIAAFTLTGKTARLMSHQRPRMPILALTPSEHVYRRMNLYWGVIPIWTTNYTNDPLEIQRRVREALFATGLLRDEPIMVVLISGYPHTESVPTNFLQIFTVS